MAIRINLYHEIQRARIVEQYDPLKISLMCLGFIGVCLVGWYFMSLNETNKIRDEHSTQQVELGRLKPLAIAAKDNEQKFNNVLTLASSLSKRIDERFYWAPVLDKISAVIPPAVQITKMTGESNFGEIPRRVNVNIEGVAAGNQPRKVAEDLRLKLNETLGRNFKELSAVFKSLDDSIERVVIDGKEASTVLFSISISFTIETIPTAPAPAPVAPAPSAPDITAQR